MAAEFYMRHGYQFGVEVVQNIGPYGLLQYPRIYGGIMPAPKIAFGILFPLAFAGLVLLSTRYFETGIGRTTWLVCSFAVALAADASWDPTFYLFHILAAHYLLTRDRYRSFLAIDGAVLFFEAILALTKSTNLVLSAGVVGAALLQSLVGRRFSRFTRDAAISSLSFLLLWMLAGQSLTNLPTFIRGAFAFTSGYNEAMAVYIPHEETLVILGILLVAVLIGVNVVRALRFRRYQSRLLLGMVEIAVLFFVWKHGHVRSDHAILFWSTALAAAPLLLLAHERREDAATAHVETCAVIGLSCAAFFSGAIVLTDVPRIQLHRLVRNVTWIFGGPYKIPKLQAQFANSRAAVALPKVVETVGSSTIDQHGFLPGVVLLNHLNYKPRPMPITFAAVNDGLQQMNAQYYRDDATAPAYLLAMVTAIDERFPPQDDALAMLEILRHYRPEFAESTLEGDRFALLKRARAAAAPAELEKISSTTVGWGEMIHTPPADGKFIWCTVEINPSLRGQFRAALYKPPPVRIILGSGQIETSYKFIASEGRTGFLVHPTIVTTDDLIGAYGEGAHSNSGTSLEMDTFRFELDPADNRDYFQDSIIVTFWKVV